MSTGSASFWRRQVAPRPTPGQKAFDLAFGIALPVICLLLDPIVFQSSLPVGEPLLGRHAIAARVAMGLAFLSLSVWMLIGWPRAFMGGLLAGSAIFATLLGLVLLPFSIMGLFFVVGILGFSPFLTAFVFWRNAVRAFRWAREGTTELRVLIPAAVGLAISCGSPWAVQSYVTHETSRALEMVQSDNTAEAADGLSVLKRFRALANFDRLVFAYQAEKDEARRERLAAAYKDLTGAEIEHRLVKIRD